MKAKRFPLPKRFNAALSEKAYENLQALNSKYGYGNNYLLTIILESLEDLADSEKLDKVFSTFKNGYGAPRTGNVEKSD